MKLSMEGRKHILVFPAASKPSIRIRISFVPNIFPIILDTCPPILARYDAVSGEVRSCLESGYQQL